MSVTRRRLIKIAAGAGSLVGLGSEPALSSGLREWRGFALGADCAISLAGISQSKADRVIALITKELAEMEDRFSLYRADSELARLNRTGNLEDPSQDMRRLLRLCGQVHALTFGKFDPTVQPVWRLLADTAGQASDAQLQAAWSKVGWEKLEQGRGSIRFSEPGMALTLNGIAQGYATDKVAAILRANGCTNVLIDIGEIVALGQKKPDTPWRIGISESASGLPDQTISLTNQAIATSAPLGTVLNKGGTLGHILDPVPKPDASATAHAWRRVSVIATSAALADGLSTGFCLIPKSDIENISNISKVKIILS